MTKRLIEVANLRETSDGMICDRTSALGNPFCLVRGAGLPERRQVVRLYGCYLHLVANRGHEPIQAIKAIKNVHPVIVHSTRKPDRSEFMEALGRLEWVLESGYLRLLCWCAPLPCHCDRIKDYLLWKNHDDY
jgi:hypothetical protein